MDIQALKRTKEKLDEKTGSDGFLNQKNIGTETVVRLLPPSPQLGGLFHMEVVKYWIAGKSIICASTFGKKSVIQEELDAARASDDDDLVALANNADTKTGVSRKVEFWMTLLQLEYKLNKREEIIGYTVIDDKAKVFQCGSQLLSSMIKVATSRKAITAAGGAEDAIADRESGSNLILSKAGQKLNTKYDAAIDESMEIDPKYYVSIPDVYVIAQAQMKNASYQRAVIRQYLYGDDIPKDVQAKEDARMAKVKEAYAQAAAPAKKKKVVDDDDDADEKPAKKKSVEITANKKKKILTEDDDEDAEDEPVKKKKKVIEDDDDDEIPAKKTAKKKVVDEDDDDEDEKPVKKTAKKKAISDDEDDDDEPAPAKKSAKKKVADDDEDDDLPPAKKSAKKKATVTDDDDDDDDAPPAKKSAKKKKTILDDVDDDLEDD